MRIIAVRLSLVLQVSQNRQAAFHQSSTQQSESAINVTEGLL
jgi:hypothetical protein